MNTKKQNEEMQSELDTSKGESPPTDSEPVDYSVRPAFVPAKPPAGMTKHDTDLDNYDPWAWDVHPVLEAVVIKCKRVAVPTTKGEVDRWLAVVRVDDEVYCMWESRNLTSFMEVLEPDMRIFVEFTGWSDLKAQRRMRMFNAYHS